MVRARLALPLNSWQHASWSAVEFGLNLRQGESMKHILLAATMVGVMNTVAVANPDTEHVASAQGSFASQLTRGAVVSSTIRTYPTDPIQPGARGDYVRTHITTLPPNPIKDGGVTGPDPGGE